MRAWENITPGLVLGRYEFLMPIARGGMAAIWAARVHGARGFQKTVILKTMLPEISEDQAFEKMFLDEARVASRIHHPNVVEILDLGEEDKLLYIAMEWIDGEPLTSFLKENGRAVSIPVSLGVKIAADVCAGLHAVHELHDERGEKVGLVHRDVTPQNILVTYEGVVKLVDFGVAKADATTDESTSGQVKGKIRYMAPEQVLSKKVDGRTDLFSLGIVLYQLTTGKHPWGDETQILTLRNIMTRPPIPPSQIVPGYPPDLERVVLKALQRESKARWQTALEMRAALEALYENDPRALRGEALREYIGERLGEKGRTRREQLRRAILDADERLSLLGPLPTPSGGVPSSAMIAAIRAGAPMGYESIGGIAVARSAAPRIGRMSMANAGLHPRSHSAFLSHLRPRSVLARSWLSMVVIATAIGASVALRFRTSDPLPPHAAASLADPTSVPSATVPVVACPADMVKIPADTFTMGSLPGDADEKPVHQVQLSTYCIDLHEVTVLQWKACSEMGECESAPNDVLWSDVTPKEKKALGALCNGRNPDKRLDHPINCVDWTMASHYCSWAGRRLPTEAEWEYAARGGDGRTYPWGEDPPDNSRLNACGKECASWSSNFGIPTKTMYRGDDGYPSTAPVGSFPAGRSPFGLEDTAGNVWEWVADWSGPYGEDLQTNPSGPRDGGRKIVRGGAFNGAFPSWVRPTQRYSDLPNARSHAYGFRCAKSL